MKALIVYKGRYGATQQYTQWVAEDLGVPVYTPKSLHRDGLIGCDFVVMGSSVYMGQLLIRDWLKENTTILKNKKIFLYIVCATPASQAQKREEIVNVNVPVQLRNRMEIFFFPGRLVIGQLSWKDRLFLRLGSMLEKDPVKKKAMQQDIDGVKRENIAGLIKRTGEFSAGAVEAGTVELFHHIT